MAQCMCVISFPLNKMKEKKLKPKTTVIAMEIHLFLIATTFTLETILFVSLVSRVKTVFLRKSKKSTYFAIKNNKNNNNEMETPDEYATRLSTGSFNARRYN